MEKPNYTIRNSREHRTINNTIVTLFAITISCLSHAQSLNFQWATDIDGYSFSENQSVAIDDNGNVLTTGAFNGTIDFNPGTGVNDLTSIGFTDVFIQKLDSNGDFIWAKNIGSTVGFAKGQDITVDANGNIYVTGYFENTVDFDPSIDVQNAASNGGNDIFILKLDGNGNFIWVKHMGGAGSLDKGNAIALDPSGNIYTTGWFDGTADFDPGTGQQILTASNYDTFIQKLDPLGNLIWVKQMSGGNTNYGESISIDGSGNVVTTGAFRGSVDFDPGNGTFNLSSAGSDDIFIQKLDMNGDFIWAKKMGGSGTDYGNALTIDANDNIYTTGLFSDTVDFNPGTSQLDQISVGGEDIFVQKLDLNGNFIWLRHMGSTGNDAGKSIITSANGNIFITGLFEDSVDFDPSQASHILASAGNSDIFIQQLDPNGNLLWVGKMGSIQADYGNAITADNNGNICIAGQYRDTIDFDPSNGIFELVCSSHTALYIQKLAFGIVSTKDISPLPSIVAYPNPTYGDFVIDFKSVLQDAEITIRDLQGRLITFKTYQNISILNQNINGPAGIYVIEIKTPEGSRTISLVKE